MTQSGDPSPFRLYESVDTGVHADVEAVVVVAVESIHRIDPHNSCGIVIKMVKLSYAPAFVVGECRCELEVARENYSG